MDAGRRDCMGIGNARSERRILYNRIRRERELKKNFLLFIATMCLVAFCSVSLSGFHASAKDDREEASCKCYKSIVVSANDTLWSIAEQYMDQTHYDSIQDYISEVKRMNSLADDAIHYGAHLVVPYYSRELPSSYEVR